MGIRVPKFGNVRNSSPVVLWTSEWVDTGGKTKITDKWGHTVEVDTFNVRGIINPEGSLGFIVNNDTRLLVA